MDDVEGQAVGTLQKEGDEEVRDEAESGEELTIAASD